MSIMYYHFQIPDDVDNPLTEAGRVYPVFESLSHALLWPVIDARRQEMLRSVMKEQRLVVPVSAVAFAIFILSRGDLVSIANPFPFLALILPLVASALIGGRSYRKTIKRLEAEASEEGTELYWEILCARELGRPSFTVRIENTRHTFRF